jgi:hypothetical protein
VSAGRILAQVAIYGLFLALVGGLSDAPVYQRMEPDQALLRVVFSHSGQPIHECKRLSQAELNALPPNMRNPVDCPRQRLPIQVELQLDAQTILAAAVPPSGLWGDGEATLYEQFQVPAGPHRLTIRMRDSSRSEGFDYQLDRRVHIKEMQNLVIGFDPGSKQFVIH